MTDLRRLPKVVLHDHLDGGVRPGTVLDLAADLGYPDLPADDEAALARWFHQGDSASLESYLEAFRHTFGVMQTPEALRRTAFEAVADHAAEGVVYAELRFAPSLHTARGLTRSDAIAAVLQGLHAAETAFDVGTGLIVDALRQESDSMDVARAAIEFSDRGVVAFDLAGPERGHPAEGFADACAAAVAGGLHLTIHAGEGDGVASIGGAISVGAERIGHGARLIEDVTSAGARVTGLGPVATTVMERRLALELCPTSNLHTGMYPSPAAHPIGALHRAGFVVTINTDNRLMSGITMTDEFSLVVDHQGFEVDDLRAVTLQAVDAAFCTDAVRDEIRERVERGYRAAT